MAPLLCTIMVIRAPTPMPIKLFRVKLLKIERILSPAAFCKPPLIKCMPNKNKISPLERPNSKKIHQLDARACKVYMQKDGFEPFSIDAAI